MTQAEWQEKFDAHFPDGALVTQAITTEDASRTDESPQFLTDRIKITGIEDDGDVEVSFFIIGANREVRSVIREFQTREYGFWAVASDDGRSLAISNQLSDTSKKMVAIQRELESEEA